MPKARQLDDALMDNLQRAVVTIHSGSVAAEYRQAAQRFLDEFKKMEVGHDLYAYALIDKSLADEVRFFGFHLLEHFISTQWLKLALHEKNVVRSTLLAYIEQGTKDFSVEKRFIKEKAVSLIVQVASHDWPAQWSNLLDLLVQIAGQGETQLELVLIALRNLAEEVKVFNERLPEKQLQEMNNALQKALPDIIAFFKKFLEFQYTVYLEARGANQATAQEKHAYLIKTVFNTIKAYLEWTPISLIVSNGFPLIFSALLQDTRFRMISCDCLLLVLNQSSSETEDQRMILFPFEYMEAIGKAFQVHSDAAEDHEFRKKLASFLSLLGQKHLKIADNTIPPFYDMFLSSMLMMIQHVSLKINDEGFTFWQTLVKSKFAEEMSQQFATVFPQVLASCYQKNIKLPHTMDDPESSSFPPQLQETIRLIEDDFEPDTFRSSCGSIRSKILVVIQEIASKQPELALRFAGERLQQSMCSDPPLRVKKTSYYYLSFESAISQLEASLRGVTEIYTDPQNKTDALKYVEGLLGLLYNYKPSVPIPELPESKMIAKD